METYGLDASEYLEETVFPTLLPALEKLLKAVKRHDSNQVDDTVQLDPINWLAQV